MNANTFISSCCFTHISYFVPAITYPQAEGDEWNINDYGDYVVAGVPDQIIWLDAILNAVEHMNSFEGRSTEYSKVYTRGTWLRHLII